MKIQPSGSPAPTAAAPTAGTGFADALILSRHAQRRLRERNIGLDAEQSRTLGAAMAEARKAGSRQAAVVMAHAVFVVAPATGTVVTGIDPGSQAMQVMTNVDAVVVVGRSVEGAPHSRPTDGMPANALHWNPGRDVPDGAAPP